jgi:hypothetical protein
MSELVTRAPARNREAEAAEAQSGETQEPVSGMIGFSIAVAQWAYILVRNSYLSFGMPCE